MNSPLSELHRKQSRIFNVLRSLADLPKVSVDKEESRSGIETMWIKHPQQYVPDFKLEWCPGKQHYRVYIHVAHTSYEKTNAGYCICTVASAFGALGFGMLYGFLHKHRANNKEAALD